MACASKRRCLHPHCNALVSSGYCSEHQPEKRERSEQAAEWHALYNNGRWRAYRLAFLASHPLCVNPFGRHGQFEVATVVDHRIAHKGDIELFWSESNHQSLCSRCHGYKTAKEDNGFGNASRPNRGG